MAWVGILYFTFLDLEFEKLLRVLILEVFLNVKKIE